MELRDWILWKCVTRQYYTRSRGVELWGCQCNGSGGEGWGAEMGPENRDWVERQIEGPSGYTRVVSDIVKGERIQNSCRVRRESLGELVDVVSKVVVVRVVASEVEV